MLTWVPPNDTSSGVGFVYTISWPGGTPVTVAGRASSTATLTGLPNDTQLLFTVRTQNEASIKAGSNGAAATYQSESAGKPQTPTWSATQPFTADNTADGSARVVTLHWNAVDPNGPAPTHYTVTRTDDKGGGPDHGLPGRHHDYL